jgi:hypothetical protein
MSSYKHHMDIMKHWAERFDETTLARKLQNKLNMSKDPEEDKAIIDFCNQRLRNQISKEMGLPLDNEEK